MPSWIQRYARQLRHRFLDRNANHALPPVARERIVQAIAASEALHTGQIRVYVETALPWSYIRRDAPARDCALMEFSKQRVWDTEHNNGVLIYVLLAEHAIEIIADRGLMQHVQATHWQSVVAHMSGAFQENRYEDGLTQALEETSGVLVTHFPRTDASSPYRNELPDTPLLQ